MPSCSHEVIQLKDEVGDGMHCQGWTCQRCDHLAVGECHHQTWCRRDFCGADPVVATVHAPVLVGV